MKKLVQKEYIGPGYLDKLSEVVSNLASNRVFLVTGKNSYSISGAKSEVEKILKDREVYHFSNFRSNPNIEDIKRGISEYKTFGPDLVIAIGGGSVIDIAKAINALFSQKDEPEVYIKGEKKLKENKTPLVAIPTTSGSGSEATHFAVVYIDNIKYSLSHESMLPMVSIIDPELTKSLSKNLTATSGADAFCQAIESYWSVLATDESRRYAREAMGLSFSNLKQAVVDPTSEARSAMSKAAHLAGRAINISKTTAPHAMSYPLTAHFNIPHGHAVSLTLPSIFLYNSQDEVGEKIINEIVEILGFESVTEVREKIEELFTDIGLLRKLSELGIKAEDISLILGEVSIERMSNNPRKMTKDDIRGVLESII